MPAVVLHSVAIRGLSTVTGEIPRRLAEDRDSHGMDTAQLERLRATIGLDQRFVSSPGVTAADLCHAAARDLIQAGCATPDSIDAILCVTQTPDHFQPSNGPLIHGWLGCPHQTAAFDINLGCSGYVYGLYLGSLMVQSGGCRRLLLLCGDTLSRCTHPKDRAVAPLFGDAGSATLLEHDAKAPPSAFVLRTDGSLAGVIQVPAGAFRTPAGPATTVEWTDAEGNTRTPQNLHMEGAEVFSFSLREVPPVMRELEQLTGTPLTSLDNLIFHQANRYIVSNIQRRLKLDPARVPAGTVEVYGNQSSASIPATLAHSLSGDLRQNTRRLALCGFGVGLSWAAAELSLGPLSHCGIRPFAGGRDAVAGRV